jgi:hypothetical protein
MDASSSREDALEATPEPVDRPIDRGDDNQASMPSVRQVS